MDMCGIAGRKWIGQLAFEFSIAGEISPKLTYELADPYRDILSRADLSRSAARRFRGRAARSGFRNGSSLREEALAQKAQCWISDPIPPNADGRPET